MKKTHSTLLLSVFFSGALTSNILAVTQVEKRLEISDWLVAGSGCETARKVNENSVKIQYTPDTLNPLMHSIRFQVPNYQLSGEQPINPKNPTFARECSLRVAVKPPQNTKIKNISFRSAFLLSKDRDVQAEMNIRILTGTGSLADRTEVFDEKKSETSKNVTFNLEADSNGKKLLSEDACEAEKIVGADMSLLNRRSSFTKKVDMNQTPNEAVLVVELEDCKR